MRTVFALLLFLVAGGAFLYYWQQSQPNEPIPPKPTPTFAADLLPIFQENCASCHGSNSSSEASFSIYPPFLSEHLQPGHPINSSLFRLVAFSTEPPHQLDPAELDTLSRWLEGGAPLGTLWSLAPLPKNHLTLEAPHPGPPSVTLLKALLPLFSSPETKIPLPTAAHLKEQLLKKNPAPQILLGLLSSSTSTQAPPFHSSLFATSPQSTTRYLGGLFSPNPPIAPSVSLNVQKVPWLDERNQSIHQQFTKSLSILSSSAEQAGRDSQADFQEWLSQPDRFSPISDLIFQAHTPELPHQIPLSDSLPFTLSFTPNLSSEPQTLFENRPGTLTISASRGLLTVEKQGEVVFQQDLTPVQTTFVISYDPLATEPWEVHQGPERLVGAASPSIQNLLTYQRALTQPEIDHLLGYQNLHRLDPADPVTQAYFLSALSTDFRAVRWSQLQVNSAFQAFSKALPTYPVVASLPPEITEFRSALETLFLKEPEFLARNLAVRVHAIVTGEALVEDPIDLSFRGTPPNDPAEIDRLASYLVAQNWDLVALAQLISSENQPATPSE